MVNKVFSKKQTSKRNQKLKIAISCKMAKRTKKIGNYKKFKLIRA